MYLFKSTNRGQTWNKITDGLSSRNLTWRIVQDHIDPDLLFLGTEFGIYFTVNGGKKWTQLNGGLPNISFRDLKIHKRENDLICASFGRSIYIYDDISVFRSISGKQMEADAKLFATRDALWYIPRSDIGFGAGNGSLGSEHFMAENPPFGATLTYYLKDGYNSSKKIRKEKENKAREKKIQLPITEWKDLDAELGEEKDKLWLVVQDAEGNTIRRLACPSKKGFNKVTWDLRYPATNMIELNPRKRGEWDNAPRGILAAPGEYSAFLMQESKGTEAVLTESVSFDVVPLYDPAENSDPKTTESFWQDYSNVVRTSSVMQSQFASTSKKLKAVKRATSVSTLSPSSYASTLGEATTNLQNLENRMRGSKAKREIGEKTIPNLGDRLFSLYIGLSNSTYGPTDTHQNILKWAEADIEQFSNELKLINMDIKEVAQKIYKAGGPYIEGVDIE